MFYVTGTVNDTHFEFSCSLHTPFCFKTNCRNEPKEPRLPLCAGWFYGFDLVTPRGHCKCQKVHCCFQQNLYPLAKRFLSFFSELLLNCFIFFLKWGTCCQPQRPPSIGHVFFPTTSVELIFSLPHFGPISQSCSFAWWRRDGAWELLVKCATTWSRCFDFHLQSGLCF